MLNLAPHTLKAIYALWYVISPSWEEILTAICVDHVQCISEFKVNDSTKIVNDFYCVQYLHNDMRIIIYEMSLT